MVLESTGETPVVMMVKLLKVLWETGLVTLDQMNRVSARAGTGAGARSWAGAMHREGSQP